MTTTATEPRAMLTGLTPEELARRVQEGSSACFVELLSRYEGRVFNFLLRRVPTAADAEDLTQEAFVRAWQRIETYDPTRRFSTWLFTIAARLASSHRRAAARDLNRARQSAREPRANDPGVHAAAREGAGRVWALADEILNDDQRSAVWLRYVEDMAIHDIARVLGKSNVAVRVALFRARRALAARLTQAPTDDRKPGEAHGAPARAGGNA